MSIDVLRVRWAEVNGSVFTENKFTVRLESKVTEIQLAIAFNVGREAAKHIVRLHNTEVAGGA